MLLVAKNTVYYLQVAMKTLQSPVAIYYFLGVFWTNVNTCMNRLLHHRLIYAHCAMRMHLVPFPGVLKSPSS